MVLLCGLLGLVLFLQSFVEVLAGREHTVLEHRLGSNEKGSSRFGLDLCLGLVCFVTFLMGTRVAGSLVYLELD